MYDTIVVATDGSHDADAAVDSAVALADRFDAALHGVHVAEPGALPPGVTDDDASDAATAGKRALERFADRAADAGVEATTAFLDATGATHDGILTYADDRDADLVVVGTTGRTGVDRLVVGSVAERTLRDATVPVLTVHADAPVDPDVQRVVVPTDGSDPASRAADHAVGLAATTDADLHAVHVVDTGVVHAGVDSEAVVEALEAAGREALDRVVTTAEEAGVTAHTDVRRGRPHEAILDYATEVDADLVAMGTHGRTGIQRVLLGSVTERVVRTAEMPVLGVSMDDDPATRSPAE
jgi:nucleotide-binding universal stress UspA family protein